MCVIAYMDGSTRLNDDDVKRMFEANPDGAGLCYPSNGRVVIRKGFFTVDALLDEYHAIPDGVPVIMHCRIATSGGINEKTCHPFAVGRSLKKTNKRSCNIAFAHNGILSGLGSKFASDTQEYVMHVVAPLVHKSHESRLEDMDYILNIIEATSQDCRFAFMDASGDVRLIGEWSDYHGAKVSNLAFTATSYTWGKWRHQLPTRDGRYPLEFKACEKCGDSKWCRDYGACCQTEQEAEWSSGYTDDDSGDYLESSWYSKVVS